MNSRSISQRWSELVAMTNSEEGRAQIQLEYLLLAANKSSSAIVVLAATPIQMVEAMQTWGVTLGSPKSLSRILRGAG
jgi:hypothetical protein